MGKIGVFGGTFNPVHKGHEIVALEFFDKFALDKLIIIPTNIPPHKIADQKASPQNRLEMCKVCFGKYKTRQIEVSDIEIKKEGVSYTINTLAALLQAYPGDLIYFLIGSDMFLYLKYWRGYRELLKMCVFVVAFRQGGAQELSEVAKFRDELSSMGHKIELLENKALEVSSSWLRDKLKGRDCAELGGYISPEVIDYIKERELYVLQ